MPNDIEKKALSKLKEKLEKPKEDAFASDDIVESLRDEFKQEDEEIAQTDDIFTDAVENILEEESLKAKKDIDSQEDYLEDEIVGDNYSVSKEDLIDNSSNGKIIPPSSESASSENIAKENALAESSNDNAIKAAEQPQQSNEPIKPAKKSSRFGIIIFAILIIIAIIIGIIFFL